MKIDKQVLMNEIRESRMKLIKLSVCGYLSLVLASTAMAMTHIDQSATMIDDVLVETASENSTVVLQQSFVPSFSRLSFIELNVAPEPVGANRMAKVSLWRNGQMVRESNVSMLPTGCTTDDLPISCPNVNANGTIAHRVYLAADLIPGEEHIFKIESADSLILALSTDYPHGSLSVGNIAYPAQDLWFKTGYLTDVRPYDPYRYWTTGVVVDVIEFNTGAAPENVHPGDPVSLELGLADSGSFIGEADGISAYASDYAMQAQIRINDNLISARASRMYVADNIPASAGVQDIVGADYSQVLYSDLRQGEKSFEIDIVFSEESAAPLSNNEIPDLAVINNFSRKQVIISAIDASSPNPNGSESLEAGYMVVIQLGEIVPAITANYLANFSITPSLSGFELSGRDQVSHKWYVEQELIGQDPSINIGDATDTAYTIKHFVENNGQTLAKIATLSNPLNNMVRFVPQQVVQLHDVDADGSFDEYVYNPATVKVGRDDSGIYAVQLYTPTADLYESQLFAHMRLVNPPDSPLHLLVSDSYYANYTNLEEATDPHGRPVIGQTLVMPDTVGDISFPLDSDPMSLVTSYETRYFLVAASTSPALVELEINRAVPFLLLSSISSSDSSSSVVASSSSSALESSSSTSSIASSSVASSSSSAMESSSSISSIASSSVASSSSSSVVSSSSANANSLAPAVCSFNISSEWPQGFVATIRIFNVSETVISGWDVNWSFIGGASVVGSWNADLEGNGPYSASNLSWNAVIYPGQYAEFGIQAQKSVASVTAPTILGEVCR